MFSIPGPAVDAVIGPGWLSGVLHRLRCSGLCGVLSQIYNDCVDVDIMCIIGLVLGWHFKAKKSLENFKQSDISTHTKKVLRGRHTTDECTLRRTEVPKQTYIEGFGGGTRTSTDIYPAIYSLSVIRPVASFSPT